MGSILILDQFTAFWDLKLQPPPRWQGRQSLRKHGVTHVLAREIVSNLRVDQKEVIAPIRSQGLPCRLCEQLVTMGDVVESVVGGGDHA